MKAIFNHVIILRSVAKKMKMLKDENLFFHVITRMKYFSGNIFLKTGDIKMKCGNLLM